MSYPPLLALRPFAIVRLPLAKEALDVLPQLRTIPVGKSIQHDLEILPYEQAEALVKNQKKFLVAPCICRRERQLKSHSCDKTMDACLIFGWAADYYERNGLGRKITLEETLEILKGAEKEGLVLQPSNSQEITNICCCCGDCCQILLNLKRHPAPAQLASSPFVVDARQPQVPLNPKKAHLWRSKARAVAKGDLESKIKRLKDAGPPRPS